MALTAKEIKQLAEIVQSASALLEEALRSLNSNEVSGITKSKLNSVSHDRNKAGTRKRRTGRELAEFRKMIKAERRKGTTASTLAKKHGVSMNYIYQI